MKIINKTIWNTAHLKAILQRCAAMEFDDGRRRKHLQVQVVYTRTGGCSGYAYYDSNVSTVRIANPEGRVRRRFTVPLSDPRPGETCTYVSEGYKLIQETRAVLDVSNDAAMRKLKRDVAATACHEFAHNRGMRHGQMPGYYRWGGSPTDRTGHYNPRYDWAEDMPLEVKAVQTKPSRDDVFAKKRANAVKKLALARTRLKRAKTIEQKWIRKLRYYEKRWPAAAQGPPTVRTHDE